MQPNASAQDRPTQELRTVSDKKKQQSKSPLSLPKGGGAIKGLNEKFSVDAFTGSASSSLAIFSPPERLSKLGEIALSYNSSGGNKHLGIGWSLTEPSVKRRSDKGIPTYGEATDSADIFVAPGTDDLVRVSEETLNGWVVIRYRSRVEKAHSLIQYFVAPDDPANSFWRIISKENVTSVYGVTSNGRIANPDAPAQVFEWKLQLRFDDRGNVATYEYATDEGDFHGQRFVASYPARYAFGTRNPFVPESAEKLAQQLLKLRNEKFLFEVRFDYGPQTSTADGMDRLKEYETNPNPEWSVLVDGWNERSDKTSSCRSGFLIQTRRLCRRALVFNSLPSSGLNELDRGYDGLVRSFEFHYDESPYVSKLTSITQVNYRKPFPDEVATAGEYIARCMPPTDYVYAPMPSLSEARIESADVSGLPNIAAGSEREWTDINSDGAPGLLVKAHSGAWTYYRNRGDGRLASGEAVVASPTAATGSAAQLGSVQLMDLGADGSQDLVDLTPGFSWYREREDDAWAALHPVKAMPNVDLKDPNTKLLDIDGDGLADIVITGNDGVFWFKSRGEKGFDSRKRVCWESDENCAPRILFNDGNQTLYTNDMSGDGLFDIVRIRNGEIAYWPNLGHGRFGCKIQMENAPWFDQQHTFDPARIKFADVDGSGMSDILYLSRDGIQCWRNQSGDRWSEPEKIPFFAIHNPSRFSVVDLLANGTSCLVWLDEAPADPARPLRYIHLAGAPPHTASECNADTGDCHHDERRIGQKPHLLIKSLNNMGMETDFFYTTSAKFAAADRDAGQPWITKLGFPVQVIERVERHDRITRRKTVEAYRYRHGYYDGTDREFRGFAYVEQRDSVSFDDFCRDDPSNADQALHVAPAVTKTWYHTGASYRKQSHARRVRSEYFSDDPNAALLPDTQFEEAFCGEESRAAARALQGSVLRQEVYSDDSEYCLGLESRPYTVSERSYTVRRLFDGTVNAGVRSENDQARRSVFMVFPDQQIDYQYERQLDDPRISHQFTLEVDDWGNVRQSAKVAYRRSEAGIQSDAEWLTETEKEIQRRTYVSFTHRQFTNAITEQGVATWHAPAEFEERSWELRGFTPQPGTNYFRPTDFTDAHTRQDGITSLHHAEESKAQQLSKRGQKSRRLIEHVRQCFADPADGTTQLPFGDLSTPVLPGRSYKLAFDRIPELLDQRSRSSRYANNVAINTLLGQGGYKRTSEVAEFNNERANATQEAEYWWAPAPYKTYETDAFYLTKTEYDGFANITRTTFDRWHLLKRSVTDALGNHTSVSNDYRVLQPHRLSDPNDSVTDLHFDTHGLVVASAIEGHRGETRDILVQNKSYEIADPTNFFADPISQRKALVGAATTRILYDPLAYFRSSPGSPNPVWSCVLARQKHVYQDANSEVEVTFAFTDGAFEEGQTVRLNQIPDADSPEIEDSPSSLTELDKEYWLASGVRQLNNKNKPVREYEPFFKSGHHYDYRKVGFSTTVFYDPLERVIGTLHPDHSWEKTVFNAWREIRWDRNDTVLLDPQSDEHLGHHFRRLDDTDYLPGWLDLQRTAELQPTLFVGTRPTEQADDSVSPYAEWTGTEKLRRVREEFANNHNPVYRRRRHLKGIIKPPTPNSDKVVAHANTPERAFYDSLAKPFLAIADNRTSKNGVVSEPSQSQDDLFHTRTDHDIEENQRAVTDAKYRVVMAWEYDLLGNVWCTEQMDWRSADDPTKPGRKVELLAIDGQPIARWDERAHFVRTYHDSLRRQTLVTVGGQRAEESKYGEEVDVPSRHLRGQLVEEFVANTGGAGPVTTTTSSYDWHGEPTSQLRTAATALQVGSLAGNPVETISIQMQHDAHGRTIRTNHDGVLVEQRELNQLGQLNRIAVTDQATNKTPISSMRYNAREQKIEQFNGGAADRTEELVTTNIYDPLTYRLRRTLARSKAGKWQDLSHQYDPAGNTLQILDSAHYKLIFGHDDLVSGDQDFSYDSTYRLMEATGREHPAQVKAAQNSSNRDTPAAIRNGLPSPKDATALVRYVERYSYDSVGNMELLQHNSSNPWNQRFEYEEESNRLRYEWFGRKDVPVNKRNRVAHDNHGNTTVMSHLQRLNWDHNDRLMSATRSGGTQRAVFAYGATGERTTKTEFGRTRVYFDHVEQSAETHSISLVHDESRLCLIEVSSIAGTIYRHQLSNHLGSVRVEVEKQPRCDRISFEEFFPYGQSSFAMSAHRKRYRFTGKEKDQLTGLNFHSSRYLAVSLARWASVDPIGTVDHANVYAYARNNPIRFIDHSGESSSDTLTNPKVRPLSFQDVYLELPLRAFYMPMDRLLFGAEANQIVEDYLSGDPKKPSQVRSFDERSSELARKFKNSKEITADNRKVLREIRRSLTEEQLQNLPTGPQPITNYLKPRRLKRNINFSNPLTVPGHIAGGVGSGDKHEDYRKIHPKSQVVIRSVGEEIHIEAQLAYEVFETFDFSPGDLGSLGERLVTWPMRTLEDSDRAHDVPYKVTFSKYASGVFSPEGIKTNTSTMRQR